MHFLRNALCSLLVARCYPFTIALYIRKDMSPNDTYLGWTQQGRGQQSTYGIASKSISVVRDVAPVLALIVMVLPFKRSSPSWTIYTGCSTSSILFFGSTLRLTIALVFIFLSLFLFAVGSALVKGVLFGPSC